jgi:hypothetical protein
MLKELAVHFVDFNDVFYSFAEEAEFGFSFLLLFSDFFSVIDDLLTNSKLVQEIIKNHLGPLPDLWFLLHLRPNYLPMVSFKILPRMNIGIDIIESGSYSHLRNFL